MISWAIRIILELYTDLALVSSILYAHKIKYVNTQGTSIFASRSAYLHKHV